MKLLIGPPVGDAMPREQITFAVPKAVGEPLGTIEALNYFELIDAQAGAVECPPIGRRMLAISAFVDGASELVDQFGDLRRWLSDGRTRPGVIVTATISARSDCCLVIKESVDEPAWIIAVKYQPVRDNYVLKQRAPKHRRLTAKVGIQ